MQTIDTMCLHVSLLKLLKFSITVQYVITEMGNYKVRTEIPFEILTPTSLLRPHCRAVEYFGNSILATAFRDWL